MTGIPAPISSSFPEALFTLGFTDLVSVIPCGAPLAPTSKIQHSQVGKIPGRLLPDARWAGYNWRKHEPTLDDVRQWCAHGANVGLRADRFPAVDIDCTDPQLVRIIAEAAQAKLGPAPVRVGRAPKQLLMYRTDEPLGRMRLWFMKNGQNHLVEILGTGQQYLVHGTHPATLRAYQWLDDPSALGADGLTSITRDQASAFLDHVAQLLHGSGGITGIEREGNGRSSTHAPAADQGELLAPSLDAVREAVALIPNTNELFPDRTSYLKMGYAIRAAVGDEHEPEGCAIFADWAAKWAGNARAAGNDPDVVLADGRRMRGPYSVGWSWIAEQARPFGFNDAALEFETSEQPLTPDQSVIEAQVYSDQWLADQVIARRGTTLRFVPAQERFFVWTGSRWEPDTSLLAENTIAAELRRIADEVARRGATERERATNASRARGICSAGKLKAVKSLVQNDRAVVVEPDSLDRDPWLLNTPAGMVDLRTGSLGAFDATALCTKMTSVAPDFMGDCPQWDRFLAEATAGDVELERYLQRLGGYCLTGATCEQMFAFVWALAATGRACSSTRCGVSMATMHAPPRWTPSPRPPTSGTRRNWRCCRVRDS
jgi:hypothetical protein